MKPVRPPGNDPAVCRRGPNEWRGVEHLLTDLATRLLRAPPAGIERTAAWACRTLLEFFELDRFGLLVLQRNRGSVQIVLSCQAEGVPPIPQHVDIAVRYPWLTRGILSGKALGLNARDLPLEAAMDRRSCEELGILSLFVIPLLTGQDEEYILAGNSVRHERDWPRELLSRLQLAGEMIVSALRRKRLEEDFTRRAKEFPQLRRSVAQEGSASRQGLLHRHAHVEIVGQSQAIRRVLEQVEQVAATDATVLILGETGTGKELVAKAIHRLSQRSGRPLVTVNCASLPPALIESELFGREKGAYTGALTRMVGRFELANGGTLFLDEIGELPRELQSKLLRVLETGLFERLGSSATQRTDVRILAATNLDLALAVTKGAFRSDLFYRLSVFPIHLPPLRERPEDIPLLVWHFVKGFESSMGKRITDITDESLKRLAGYPWPGNVRELRNIIERAMITTRGALLCIAPAGPASQAPSASWRLDDLERETLLRALEGTGWRIAGSGGAAAALGMKRTTLHSKMKRFGIMRPSNR
ncbi:sigma-54 interaction domain-containing protein [Desulfocurvibacter africanus]|uniref:sigma-54 interaction domain-containing protein n=1 Tax=Desulfocurvibacter africanus TaxID=873 RepID=UPI0006870EA2|nr:sigma 54-interacting transcriptional regulator [Desulfocurvibacter africanus]